MGKENLWKITPVQTGKFGMVRDDIKYAQGDSSVSSFVPSVLFLVECGNRQVVVDTGFGDANLCARMLDLNVEREHPYERILEEAGVRVNDVERVIFTHLHWDHAGMACCFPNAFFCCQQKEWEMAQNNKDEYPWEWFRYLFENQERVITVNGQEEIFPGIRVRYVGGHTAGSQIVLVDTCEGLEIIAGDVMMTQRNLLEDIPVGLGIDSLELREALGILRKYEAANVYPSHDFSIFK